MHTEEGTERRQRELAHAIGVILRLRKQSRIRELDAEIAKVNAGIRSKIAERRELSAELARVRQETKDGNG